MRPVELKIIYQHALSIGWAFIWRSKIAGCLLWVILVYIFILHSTPQDLFAPQDFFYNGNKLMRKYLFVFFILKIICDIFLTKRALGCRFENFRIRKKIATEPTATTDTTEDQKIEKNKNTTATEPHYDLKRITLGECTHLYFRFVGPIIFGIFIISFFFSLNSTTILFINLLSCFIGIIYLKHWLVKPKRMLRLHRNQGQLQINKEDFQIVLIQPSCFD